MSIRYKGKTYGRNKCSQISDGSTREDETWSGKYLNEQRTAINSTLSNLIKTKEITITTGTEKYDGFYYGDMAIADISGITEPQIIGITVVSTGQSKQATAQIVSSRRNIRVFSFSASTEATLRITYVQN